MIYYFLYIIFDKLFVIYYLLYIICDILFIIYYLSYIIYYILFIIYFLSYIICHISHYILSIIDNPAITLLDLLPITLYLLHKTYIIYT